MDRITRLSDSKNLFIIIPGFTGDINGDLMSDIRNLLENKNLDYWAWDFKGYTEENTSLGTLSELIFHTKSELNLIQNLFPEKKLYFITHSQGAFVLSSVFNDIKLSYPTIMLTPAFDLGNIILQRLDGDEDIRIQNEGKILKTFRNGKSRILTKKWYQEYKDIQFKFNISPNKFISIWGNQDFIVGKPDKEILDKIIKNESLYLDGDHTFTGDNRNSFLLELDQIIDNLF